MRKFILLSLFFVFVQCVHSRDGPFCKMQVDRVAPAAAIENTVFHGSPVGFAGAPRPSYSTRYEDGIKDPVWADTAVFASQDVRIALSYTAAADVPGYAAGVELDVEKKPNEPLVLGIFGGKNKEQALSVLFGPRDKCHLFFKPGFYYYLDATPFSHEHGIGHMERVARNNVKLMERKRINRRQEIKKYEDAGLIKILWAPEKNSPVFGDTIWWKRNW